LSPEEVVALEEVAFDRARLEQQVEVAPATSEDHREKEELGNKQMNDLQSRLSEAFVSIQTMESELLAVESYYTSSKSEQRIRPDELKRPVAEIRASIAALRAAHDRIRENLIETNRIAAGGKAGRNVATRLTGAMGNEHDLFKKARSRMNAANQGELDALSALINRAGAVQASLSNFDTRVDDAADRRLGSIKERLAAEKLQIQAATGKFTALLSESQNLGGGLAQVVLTKVTDRFYDLVVQSDVGLIDVSWGLKDQKTSRLTQLITQQKQELKAIQDDFQSLLGETEK
jgi:hypothetical protein